MGTSPLSIAPMMDRTDRHFRWFMRQITRNTLLYSEMVVCRAILHGDRERHLGFDPVEHPIALQLGGDDPHELATCARMGAEQGYDEINFNVGCPSPRVSKGSFGATLMREPERVAAGVAAMVAAVDVPVTVKHRIGVDELDRYEDMLHFVDVVSQAQPARFTVHARKAWLRGLSPKENRTIPPLRYREVHRLKSERPTLAIEINGGLCSLDEVAEQLAHVDAAMIGRAAWDDPWLFAEADQRFFGAEPSSTTRSEVVRSMVDYLARQRGPAFKPHHVIRVLANLYAGQPGARIWRRTLGEGSHEGAATLERALDQMSAITLPRSS